MKDLIELSKEELFEVEGGYNLIEYMAYGIGYIKGKLDGAGASTSASTSVYTDGSFMFY